MNEYLGNCEFQIMQQVKFKIGYTDKGTVTGKITTFTLDENGDPQPFDLSDLMKPDEEIKLTPEEAPKGTLLN